MSYEAVLFFYGIKKGIVMKQRVVVTGLGIVSALGSSVDLAWTNILAGVSGAAPITAFDATGYPVTFSASTKDFDVSKYMNPKDAKRMDLFIQYGIGAAVDAIKDAGLEITDQNADRIGAMLGSGIGGLPGIEENCETLLNKGPNRISPFYVPRSIINMLPGQLSILTGFKGPSISAVTACASGTHSIGMAARMIAYGDADVMIAGGAEMATTPTGIGGFAAARALSNRNDEPTKASRPWDKDRNGFVLGDGAGVLILESYEHAVKRGARIYCELVGFGATSDAYHITSPMENGEGAGRCMQMALNDAKMNVDAVDYINAHGTSTKLGDMAELTAVKSIFGEHAYKLAMSSTKSMTGHLLGAAGGIEAVFAALSIRDNVAPPTINLDNPDEGCDINLVPHTPQERQIDVAISNSFGFGGTNGTLIFQRVKN